MIMMEGGTTFESARNGRLPTFEQRLSTRADLELGQNVWGASKRLWGTSKTLFDGTADDEQTKPPTIRQVSLSTHAQTKPAISSSRTPAGLNNETMPPSAMLWGSVSSAGFASRQRGQALSPTKQAQNQYSEFVADNSNGIYDQSSLFAGSDPDVDDLPLDTQQNQNHRRALVAGSRALPSPTRTTTFTSNQLDTQFQAFNSARFRTNSVFALAQDYENEQDRSVDGFLPVSRNPDVLPMLNGHGTLRLNNEGPSEILYRYDSRFPAEARTNDRSLNLGYVDQFRPDAGPDYDSAVQSLGALALDQPNAGAIIPRLPLTQPQFQRDIHHMPAHRGHLETAFPTATSHVQTIGSRLNPQAPPHYGGLQYAVRESLQPLTSDYRSNITSPYYSAAGTPPTGTQSVRSTPGSGISSRTSHHDPLHFDRKFVGIDQYGYDTTMLTSASIQSSLGANLQYDVRLPEQALRMNPLANPYVSHSHAGMHHYPSGPRMTIREPEQAHAIRSPVLEDFRLNSKTNRRFELKDIYGYVVEFSGDQHGSRFLQQKLETANSDEKEQIFKEIQPNMLQLTSDVFGNYVIQKLFEHGNQTQKKLLANQMKGHVLHLSVQAYGCRVIQKAFEHVLTDQQASLVRELDGPNQQILKVVKDQNGNHVVQKAIERIPGEHIQFIVDAHRGQLAKMSTHQYGCRVVQRMLEHCEPPTKRVILDELLDHIHPLISDSFGNYVVQHIIHNGEPRDRRQVVDIILSQLLVFSKHKFASNIVEKSIDCADDDQREQLLRGLTAPDETGVTPVLALMRDQFGNYVLQKVFNQLQGSRLVALRTDMERNYPVLRRTSYGKQVMAIEKLLFGSGGPPPPPTPTASSRSSTLPSTNPSSTADSDVPVQHQTDAK